MSQEPGCDIPGLRLWNAMERHRSPSFPPIQSTSLFWIDWERVVWGWRRSGGIWCPTWGRSWHFLQSRGMSTASNNPKGSKWCLDLVLAEWVALWKGKTSDHEVQTNSGWLFGHHPLKTAWTGKLLCFHWMPVILNNVKFLRIYSQMPV